MTSAEQSDVRWNRVVAGESGGASLAEGALLIATEEYPDLDIDTWLARIDGLAQTLRQRMRADIGPSEAIITLNRYLFDELQFSGNAADYYDARNSYLNDVIERRLGIPITLSVLYIEIGRRIGLPLHGISFPGHFLVKCTLRDGAVILDPFARGVSLSREALEERVRMQSGEKPSALLLRRLLATAGSTEILARMLRNLRGIHLHHQDLLKALGAADRILQLQPEAAAEYHERGRIYMELECARAALADFRTYLRLRPGADNAASVRATVAELEQRAARLN